MRINITKAEYGALLWVANQFDLMTNCEDESYVQKAKVAEDMIISIVKKCINKKYNIKNKYVK